MKSRISLLWFYFQQKLIQIIFTYTNTFLFTGAFSSLRINFHLSRSNGYYFWNTYLPGGILVVMTWVNFWIPPWAYPARVTVCVTSFLSTLVVMSTAGNQLGRVSYVKAIDYFLIGNATFVMMILFEYVLVLHSWWDLHFDFFKRCFKKKVRFISTFYYTILLFLMPILNAIKLSL